jgi:hypothetical protein
MRPELGRNSFSHLHKALRSLLDLTAESRNAEVQRRIVSRLRADTRKCEGREYNRLTVNC